MEWVTLTTIVSTILALFAFVFSIIIYLRTEREKERGDLRQFLVDSVYAADRLRSGLASFVFQPNQKTLDVDVMPVINDLLKLKQLSLRWHQEEFYPEFNLLLVAIGSLGAAIENFTRKGGQVYDVIEKTKQALYSAEKYASKARDTLLKL